MSRLFFAMQLISAEIELREKKRFANYLHAFYPNSSILNTKRN